MLLKCLNLIFTIKKILPCSAFLNGEYGVKGLFVGVPVIIGEKGIEKIVELDLSNQSKKNFKNQLRQLSNWLKNVKNYWCNHLNSNMLAPYVTNLNALELLTFLEIKEWTFTNIKQNNCYPNLV